MALATSPKANQLVISVIVFKDVATELRKVLIKMLIKVLVDEIRDYSYICIIRYFIEHERTILSESGFEFK